MTLTVRLDETLESALDRYCVAKGVTKSLVVQESLAAYLLDRQAPAAEPTGERAPARLSANYRAFADAGLVGAGELGGTPADKAAVRARALQRIGRKTR